MTSIITLATDMSTGTITVSNTSDSDIDIAGYTIVAEDAGEVREPSHRLHQSGCIVDGVEFMLADVFVSEKE